MQQNHSSIWACMSLRCLLVIKAVGVLSGQLDAGVWGSGLALSNW